ncbi:MAG: hypothetical protein IKQ92_09610, partial [Clostridia bacterium]|nr:hypothetical protein [Clostridia bacterium]
MKKLLALLAAACLTVCLAVCLTTAAAADGEKHSISILNYNPTIGTIATDVSSAAAGETVTLTVTPNEGCTLGSLRIQYGNTNLTPGQTGDTTYSFTMPDCDVQVTVEFRYPCTVTANADPASGGTVSGGGTYMSGDWVSLTASPNAGYHFVKWKYGEDISYSPTLFFNLQADILCQAVFAEGEAERSYTLSPSAVELTGAGDTPATFTLEDKTVQGAVFYATFNAGTLQNVSGGSIPFKVNDSSHFTNGSFCDGHFTNTGDTLTVLFGIDLYYYNAAVPGVYTGTCNYTTKWVDISSEREWADVPGSVALMLTIPDPVHSVSVTSQGGTASASPASALEGETVTLTAAPDEGYAFKGWEVVSGGVTVENNQFVMGTSDVAIRALFEQVYSVTIDEEVPPAAVTLSGGRIRYEAGETVTLTVTPEEGYALLPGSLQVSYPLSLGLIVPKQSAQDPDQWTFTMPAADAVVQARFYRIGDTPYVDPTDPAEPLKTRENCAVLDAQYLHDVWYSLDNDGWYVVDSTFRCEDGIIINADVCLILTDGCTLDASCIGIRSGRSLSIYGQTEGTGKLLATAPLDNFAAIGGFTVESYPYKPGTITVNGGTITAVGGSDGGAGIGGAKYGSFGTIMINGGTVTATGGSGAAGIGSGYGGDGGTIVINGGTVTATGGSGAVGIGSGYDGDAGTVTITGGTVDARGGVGGAGIGGSDQGDTDTLTVGFASDGSSLTASGYGCAVTVAQGRYVRYTDDSGVTHVLSGSLTDEEKEAAAGRALTKSAGPILYKDQNGNEQSAAAYTVLTAADEVLTGWYAVTADTNIENTRLKVSGDAFLILCDDTVLRVPKGIEVDGQNSLTVYGQDNDSGELIIDDVDGEKAGIGGGDGSNGGTITICGGTVTAEGGGNAAGIGGGWNGEGGRITITGGMVNAAGSGGAGIGSGTSAHFDANGSAGLITISGGTVNATGGEGGGAGIGGGNGSGGTAAWSGGTIIISGGTVNATGGFSAAGIGGGIGGDGGTIAISGGTVIARGGSARGFGGAAGIGGGVFFDGRGGYGGSITVTGGTVNATGGEGGAGIGGSIG